MNTSELFESTGIAVASPNGQYIASQTQEYLCIQYAHSLQTAFSFPLTASASRSTTDTTSTPPRSVHWSHSSQHILLTSTKDIAVFSLNALNRNVRITNGSEGLGRIVAAEVVGLLQGGEQVFVVWEFGRTGIWDLISGRPAEELGDLKTGVGKLLSLSGSWSLRRMEGKVEVLALLSRVSAQDTLTLFLPPSTTAFEQVALPTSDAQSISWSPCGKWLAVLDSPLASGPGIPSLYIYTPDGHLFRSYPSSNSSPSSEKVEEDMPALGPRSLRWAKGADRLALASSMDSKINILSAKTFRLTAAFDPAVTPPEFCHQEIVAANGAHSYNLFAASLIPKLPEGAAADMEFNSDGRFLAAHYEGAVSTVMLWDLEADEGSSHDGDGEGDKGEKEKIRAPAMIVQHSPIRKLLWHPVRSGLLMIITEDTSTTNAAGVGVYLLDATVDAPPLYVEHAFSKATMSETGRVDIKWLSSNVEEGYVPRHGRGSSQGMDMEKLKILVSSRKRGWFVIWPEGRADAEGDFEATETQAPVMNTPRKEQSNLMRRVEEGEDQAEEGDESQDSLYDILSGRTPLPELGTGRMLQRSEDEDKDGEATGLNDTFREQKGRKAGKWEDFDDEEMF